MNQWDSCQMKYFLTYIMGHKEKSNKKADMGTAVHCVCEILAIIKQYIQEHPLEEDFEVEHEHIGKIQVNKGDLYCVSYLSDSDVDKINKSRKNKAIYCDQQNCYLEYGHKRYGNTFINKLIKQAYDLYVASNHDDQPSDFKCVYNWTWMALEGSDRRYDPRFCDILKPEQRFDVQLDEEWAKYDFTLDGEKLSGHLSLKGTVDLMRIHDEDTIEIVDWKTGARKNWSTGKVKELDCLMQDTQLMLYYLAVRLMYPQYKNIIITIYFIRDGGPFTLPFDDSILPTAKQRIRELFEEAIKLKDKLGLPSVDTALLMMIQQDIDTIRFHNSD